MDYEFFYREILNVIKDLNCSFDHHDFHKFIKNHELTTFNFGGKFGKSFTLQTIENQYGTEFKFVQDKKEETKESIEWINKANSYLKKI